MKKLMSRKCKARPVQLTAALLCAQHLAAKCLALFRVLARFPVVTPSHNRWHTVDQWKELHQASGFVPKYEQAKLDIKEMMQRAFYAQIVAVNSSEIEHYKREFPFHTFFELPKEADDLGVGAKRHYHKRWKNCTTPELQLKLLGGSSTWPATQL